MPAAAAISSIEIASYGRALNSRRPRSSSCVRRSLLGCHINGTSNVAGCLGCSNARASAPVPRSTSHKE